METWKRTVYISLVCVFCTAFGVKPASSILPLYFHDLGVQTPESMSLWSGLATGATYIIVCLSLLHFGGVWRTKRSQDYINTIKLWHGFYVMF